MAFRGNYIREDIYKAIEYDLPDKVEGKRVNALDFIQPDFLGQFVNDYFKIIHFKIHIPLRQFNQYGKLKNLVVPVMPMKLVICQGDLVLIDLNTWI